VVLDTPSGGLKVAHLIDELPPLCIVHHWANIVSHDWDHHLSRNSLFTPRFDQGLTEGIAAIAIGR